MRDRFKWLNEIEKHKKKKKERKRQREISFRLERETWAILISVTFSDLKYFIRAYFLGM